MDSDNIFTSSVFEPSVPFTGVTEPLVQASGAAKSLTLAVAYLRSAVATSLLSVCVVAAPAAQAAASADVLHPTAIVVHASTVSKRQVPWWTEFEQRVSKLSGLPDGWEPGALSISEAAVLALRATLETLSVAGTPEPTVVPTVEGGLQVEWHENGVDLEVRASRVGDLSAYFSADGREKEIRLKNLQPLRKWLSQLSADAAMHA